VLSSGDHFLDLMVLVPNSWSRCFGILHIALGINCGLRHLWILDIFVYRSCPEDLLGVSDKLVTQILRLGLVLVSTRSEGQLSTRYCIYTTRVGFDGLIIRMHCDTISWLIGMKLPKMMSKYMLRASC